jgi:putative ABC transport system permease protein
MRMLARSRSVTVIAIVTLALGIGVNSAIFSVVHAVLLRPLPMKNPDRLVTIVLTSAKLNATGAQPGFSAYAGWREHGRLWESMAAATSGTATLEAGTYTQTARHWRVTATFLSTLGVNPAVGRDFAAEEDQPGGPRAAILSADLWRNSFSADPRVLGTTVKLDREIYTIIGVLPRGFHVDGRPADIYTPFARSLNSREWLGVSVYARLRHGVTVEQAQAELDAMRKPDANPATWRPQVWTLRDFEVREVRLSLFVLLGAVGLVLMIACANIASLLLAKAHAREQEVAIRAALGAGRTRLLRQMLTESTLLALLGGAAGIGVSALCVRAVPLLMHERLPGLLEQTRVDGAVLVFTLVLAVATGLLFGVVPALLAADRNPYDTIKAGRRSGRGEVGGRAFRALVVVETALALVLAIGATLLIRTFFYLRDVAPGFKVEGLLIATVNSERNRFASPQECLTYYQELIRNVRAIPGVAEATFAQSLPLTGDNYVMNWQVEGHAFTPARPQDSPVQWQRTVDTNYFRTMQIPLRLGRLFDERDTMSAPKVVIVNEAFVRRFWPGQNPLGKHIGGGPVPVFEVVGVVGDVRHQDSTKDAPNEVFFHYQQGPSARVSLAIRADPSVYRRPLLLESGVRRAIAVIDGKQAVTRVAEIQQVISDRIAPKRLSAQLIAVFAGLATLLALVGIYGVLSFSVARRTHEFGVRMALGAEPGSLLRMVVREAAVLAGTGIAIGIAVSLGLNRLIKSLIFGVSTMDATAYAATAAATLGLAILAAFLPAWRAARVDPLLALREE